MTGCGLRFREIRGQPTHPDRAEGPHTGFEAATYCRVPKPDSASGRVPEMSGLLDSSKLLREKHKKGRGTGRRDDSCPCGHMLPQGWRHQAGLRHPVATQTYSRLARSPQEAGTLPWKLLSSSKRFLPWAHIVGVTPVEAWA